MAPAQAAGAAAQAPPGRADHRLALLGPWRFLEEPDLLEPIVPLLLPQVHLLAQRYGFQDHLIVQWSTVTLCLSGPHWQAPELLAPRPPAPSPASAPGCQQSFRGRIRQTAASNLSLYIHFIP